MPRAVIWELPIHTPAIGFQGLGFLCLLSFLLSFIGTFRENAVEAAEFFPNAWFARVQKSGIECDLPPHPPSLTPLFQILWNSGAANLDMRHKHNSGWELLKLPSEFCWEGEKNTGLIWRGKEANICSLELQEKRLLPRWWWHEGS